MSILLDERVTLLEMRLEYLEEISAAGQKQIRRLTDYVQALEIRAHEVEKQLAEHIKIVETGLARHTATCPNSSKEPT